MATLTELKEEVQAKRYIMHQISQEFQASGGDWGKVQVLGPGSDEEKRTKFNAMDRELADLGADLERELRVHQALQQHDRDYTIDRTPVNAPPWPQTISQNGHMLRAGPVNLRKLFEESPGFKALRRREMNQATIEIPAQSFKALITLADIAPLSDRRPQPEDMPTELRTVSDLMGRADTDSNNVSFYQMSVRTNLAAPVPEGTAKPESTLDWTLVAQPVETIATHIPVTRQALEDNSFLDSLVRTQLSQMVMQVEETQILTGNGTTPNLRGILNVVGIQTQAKGTDETPAAFYKAAQLIRGASGTGFAEPSAIIINPNDWTDIKLLRDTTGRYLYDGGPSAEAADRLWGWEVRQTTALTVGTGLIGAFRQYCLVVRRMGISVTASSEHASNFVENKVELLAESRLSFLVLRPSAICTVTGI
jgi:HK97 family phage major capsid protein